MRAARKSSTDNKTLRNSRRADVIEMVKNMMPMDSTELFRNSIDCVKGNIVKWRKEQQQQNFNTEVLHERIQESEKKLCLAEMKLELMNERKEIAENDLSILKEAFEKANSENLKMCSENCRIENELLEQKNAKEKLQGDNELLKLKLERLQNKYQRLKDEKNEISRKNILMEDITSKYNEAQRKNSQLRNELKDQRRALRSWEQKYKMLEAKKVEDFSMLEKSYKGTKDENNEILEKLNENTREYYKLKEVCDEEMSQKLAANGMILDLQHQLTEFNMAKDESIEKLKFTEDLLEETKKKAKESESLVATQKEKLDLVTQTVKKFENLLSEARAELKKKIDECSELRKNQLATDFELREIKRNKTEMESELKYMQEYHEQISKRNIELETEINNLKFYLNRNKKEKEDNGWNDIDENVFIKQTVARLRLSRKLYEDFKEEISANSQSKMVEKLKNDLKEKENVYQSMQVQLNSAKQELDRLNQKELLISNERQLDIFDEDEKDINNTTSLHY